MLSDDLVNSGKGLGGSSTINFFQYHRPAKSDIDGSHHSPSSRVLAHLSFTAFEKLGNPGWNWDLLKKYYIKQESFVPPKDKAETMSFDLKEHGSDGE